MSEIKTDDADPIEKRLLKRASTFESCQSSGITHMEVDDEQGYDNEFR